jgi:peptide/nickel transport system ATP-binding protein
MAVLELSHVGLAIGDTPILHDLSFAIGEGEIMGLVGESGSGKSMTALSIMHLLPRDARLTGRITLDGESLTDLGESALCERRGREMSMVFQEPMTALNPVRTIGDQIAETVRIHRDVGRADAERLTREVMTRVELDPDRFPLDRYPHDLSGGQRQRVMIAMAIILRPKLLIADEPTTALDVTTQARILDLMKRLVDEDGMSLLLITHDLAVVAGLADHVAIMKDGAIVEAGETVALFRSLRHPYSRGLFAASAHVPARNRRPVKEDETPILAASGLVHDYRLPRRSLLRAPGTFRAVDHVDLEIGRGENVGLVGESGCGKSTLARALLALVAPTAGGVVLDGRDFLRSTGRARNDLRRHIQAVFQDPYGSFDPRHRVERLVAEPFHLLERKPGAAERRRLVEEALVNVGLAPSDADKYPHEFSGGQRQRIAIARALITSPSLIVLDEAVSALDVSIRAQILDLLADLSDRLGVSYLFISHDLTVVRAITDRVLIMQAGRIVEEGATETVFAKPSHPYTASLIAATPDLGRAIAARQESS